MVLCQSDDEKSNFLVADTLNFQFSSQSETKEVFKLLRTATPGCIIVRSLLLVKIYFVFFLIVPGFLSSIFLTRLLLLFLCLLLPHVSLLMFLYARYTVREHTLCMGFLFPIVHAR